MRTKGISTLEVTPLADHGMCLPRGEYEYTCYGRLYFASKMMYGRIRVGHNWQKSKLKSNKCLCCGNPDETCEPLLGCKNEKMAQSRREAYTLMQNECTQLKLPLNFTATVIKALKVTLERAEPPTTTEVGPLQETIAA